MDKSKRTKLTKQIRARILTERKRTGVGFTKLLRRAQNVPDGLSSKLISTWLREVQTARSDHLNFVFDAYAALPPIEMAVPASNTVNVPSPQIERLGRRVPVKRQKNPMQPISDVQRKAMRDELKRSSLRYATIMTLIPSEFSGVSLQMIKGWLNGSIAKARPEYWDCIMDVLKGLPDTSAPFSEDVIAASREARFASSQKKVPAKKKRTVIEPKPIKKTRMLHINDPTVTRPKARELNIRRLFCDLTKESLPDKEPWKPIRNVSSRCRSYPKIYQPIDEKVYDQLHAEIRRTFVSPTLLLSYFESAPSGLPPHRVSEWMRLVTRSGERVYVEWVLAAYALLPEAE